MCLPQSLGRKVHRDFFLKGYQKLLEIEPFAVTARFVHDTSGTFSHPLRYTPTVNGYVQQNRLLGPMIAENQSFSSGAKTKDSQL